MTSYSERRGDYRGDFSDRRKRLITCMGTLRLDGRRREFRRRGEGENSYVDCPTRETITLVFTVLLCSVLDALFTLYHLHEGAFEENPFMNLALRRGAEFFVAVKMGLTGCGALFLAYHQCFRLGRNSLRWVTLSYGVLLLYHLILLASN